MAQDFSLFDRVVHKAYTITRPVLAKTRRSKLNNVDFTIISNNCWGGVVYEHFGLPKLSPTVGLYFFADDYIKFVKNLKYYLSLNIKMIKASDSRHADELHNRGQDDVPVGVLDDVEIVFLHYKNAEVAKEKWERRVGRVNWNNLIIKFSYMNGCDDAILEEFEAIVQQYPKSVVFVPKEYPEYHNAYVVPGLPNGQIGDDTFHFKRYVDILSLINSHETNIR